jgi:hypothetical protein
VAHWSSGSTKKHDILIFNASQCQEKEWIKTIMPSKEYPSLINNSILSALQHRTKHRSRNNVDNKKEI